MLPPRPRPRRRPGRHASSSWPSSASTSASTGLAALASLLAGVVLAACLGGAAGKGPAAVVLLGPSGSGKSETGNTLLSDRHFKVSGGLESETLIPSAHIADYNGRKWQVVDTPGYFDTSRTPEELATALERFAEIVSDHIVVLAFVVPYGRFGDAHLRGWRLIRGAFGAAALQHTALVFTSCGERKEEDVRVEVAKLCQKTPPPMLCSVIEELGEAHGGDGLARVVTFGTLEPDRRRRDRARLYDLATELEVASGGRGYDHREFMRSQERRRLMVKRIAAVDSAEDRRTLELLLANVEAGAASDEDLVRRLQEIEGGDVAKATRLVLVDFEDRTLGPLQQIGRAWKQPMPIPYLSMRGYSTSDGSGGSLFVHTGTDSGVHIRNGDSRAGELRSAPFLLGYGRVAWQAAGGGGFVAVCPAELGEDFNGCLERRLRRRSTTLEPDEFSIEELASLIGSPVLLRVVDDKTKGWGFVAIDNLEYPVFEAEENGTNDGAGASASAAPSTATASRSPTTTTTTRTSTTTSAPPTTSEAAGEGNGTQTSSVAAADSTSAGVSSSTTPSSSATATTTTTTSPQISVGQEGDVGLA